MTKIVFVALSHTLTQEQIDSLNADKIFLLADVNADLAAQCRNIDPTFSTRDIKSIAAQVVVEAIKVSATHFFCQGEPALAMWANMIGSGNFNYDSSSTPSNIHNSSDFGNFSISLNGKALWSKKMTCLQSTTKRELISEVHEGNGEVVKRTVFKHVQWRELF